MILVDTSVWIDHLQKAESELVKALKEDRVFIHSMIIGELACGNIHNRQEHLRQWQSLPRIAELAHDDVVAVIEARGLMGRGIGFTDAHLLCATLYEEGTWLWSRDKRLARIAEDLDIAYTESSS